MAVKTSNKYGKITVSDDAVVMVANHVAGECYGVVDLVSRRLTDSLAQLFRSNSNTKGVKITCVEHYIYIDLFVILKSGVSEMAVSDTLSSTVKYAVEKFTGMVVKAVNVNVVGVRV
ncbi:MAG: Asp23/Gls24 family envelope stress response protein [Clostridia bacterium]|jgi:uncharacterized alkaline shock family protein YloU|nr:Asp23/Gls24 family envelope stress response protein [Clostridia bacterium]